MVLYLFNYSGELVEVGWGGGALYLSFSKYGIFSGRELLKYSLVSKFVYNIFM